MRALAPLAVAVRLSSPATRARGLGVAALALVERLLAPLAVTAFAASPGLASLGLGVAAALAGLRGAAQRAGAARTEAELYRRVVTAVLDGDVLKPDPIADEDVRGAVFEGLHRVARVLAETLPGLAANGLAAVLLALAATLTQPPRVVLAAVVAAAAGGAGLFASRRWGVDAESRARRAWIAVADRVADASEARVELVASGREGEFAGRFGGSTEAWEREARRAARFAGLLGRVPVVLLAAAVGAVVVLDALAGGATVLQAGLRAAVFASYTPAFLGVALGAQELVSHGPRLRLLGDLLAPRPARRTPAGKPVPAPRAVECRELGVSYGARAALRGVSFSWRPGELVVLVGANGSGKSTCLRALVGLCEETSGAVLVGDVPLGELDVAAWRRGTAFLPQRPYLPPRASVRECLRLLDADLGDAALREALDRVGMLAPLSRLAADPLDAPAGVLSAGQRQRVALARALARPAPRVILDEPDTDLDHEAATRLAEHLADLARDRMVLVSAHGPELLAAAHRVVTLADGVVTSDVARG